MSLSLSDPSLLKSQAYINGQWVDADNGATFPVTNPANGELIVEVAKVGAAETARAVAAADQAMRAWKKQPAKAARKSTKTASKPAQKAAAKTVRKKGVRRATMTTGINKKKTEKKIGRSRIPIDAPLSVVFEHFPDEKQAFDLLQIQTIRELEEFEPDELVRRLTSPAKQTVGRIRKILAMNNRCLANDESFAIEFQERIASKKLEK